MTLKKATHLSTSVGIEIPGKDETSIRKEGLTHTPGRVRVRSSWDLAGRGVGWHGGVVGWWGHIATLVAYAL